jgi:hypothetical protein
MEKEDGVYTRLEFLKTIDDERLKQAIQLVSPVFSQDVVMTEKEETELKDKDFAGLFENTEIEDKDFTDLFDDNVD